MFHVLIEALCTVMLRLEVLGWGIVIANSACLLLLHQPSDRIKIILAKGIIPALIFL